MEYITLNTGAKMLQEGFGVFQIPDQKQCEQGVYNAIKTGYRLIDTGERITMRRLSAKLLHVPLQTV